MKWNAKWLKPAIDMGDVCPVFFKNFSLLGPVKQANLYVTALGVYESSLNGNRISEDVLAPGWTSYKKRLQYQTYDITEFIQENNQFSIHVGKGWYRSRLGWETAAFQHDLRKAPAGIIAQIDIIYETGEIETIISDATWHCKESQVRFSELYDGEIYDARVQSSNIIDVEVFNGPYETLIQQQGEVIREQERLQAARLFTTPKGETIIDFGQEVTGYVEIMVDANAGDEVILSHAEVLDIEGNFYNENYRSAKAKFHYICQDGIQTYKPKFTFFGFRYIRIDQFPGGIAAAAPNNFHAIVVHSDMKRTGHLSCSNPLLNQLFSNIIWGQKGNFLDIPTDCPQRDERLGWTGDAQVFIKTAALNYDVEKFFTKWLSDLATDQDENGRVGHIIPDLGNEESSAAWADAATICPWEIYLAYGNPQILSAQYDSMKKWIHYITTHTKDTYLWTGGNHFGDWLGLDAPSGSYKGSSREELIASAFYAYSTSLVIKAGKVLHEDISEYVDLYNNIVAKFQSTYTEYITQTECVLAVHFKLALDCQSVADQLANMIESVGIQLRTGFVGTPYLLHVLSDYGHSDLAYSLLLREQYPSWLYPVTKGATTIWEHWDGIMENGCFWTSDMNSFNHYAYGAVADWVYGVAAGIKPMEEFPGYKKVKIAPLPDQRLEWLKASFVSRHGLIRSEWKKEGDIWRYEIETPVDSLIKIDNETYEVAKGTHIFYSAL